MWFPGISGSTLAMVFLGDKIPRPDGSVVGWIRYRLESHPEDVPDHGAKGFGLNGILGGGFKHFIFSSRFGEDSNFD